MSLEWPCLKMFARFWSVKKHCCDGWGGYLHYADLKKFLTFLLWNCQSDFEIISQKCSFSDLFQKWFTKFWSVNKQVLLGGGDTCTIDTKKFLKTLLKLLSNFEISSRKRSRVDPFKTVCEILMHFKKSTQSLAPACYAVVRLTCF